MYDSVWAMSTMGGNYGLLAERAALGGKSSQQNWFVLSCDS
jgi:hypothetical protein